MARIVIPGATEVLIGPLPTPLLPPGAHREKVALIHQPGSVHVATDVARRLSGEGLTVIVRELPDRERAKNLAVVGEVYEWLAAIGLGRPDTIVGVGGGALTDTAGFVAATWLRGVESVLVPTTLLGAVDASIGGKTGVNVAGKNLVGAFWHPTRVLIDPGVLASLEPTILREGFAEALKCGYIADPVLLDLFWTGGPTADLPSVIERAVRVKAEVVSEDFREEGRRAVLNYGHTLGHAIEYLSGVSHGEAVSLGMVGAAEVSRRRLGFDATDEHRRTLASLGLPTSMDGHDAGAVLDLVRLDKKRSSDGIRMVLLRGYGDPTVEVVSDDDLRAGLAAVGID